MYPFLKRESILDSIMSPRIGIKLNCETPQRSISAEVRIETQCREQWAAPSGVPLSLFSSAASEDAMLVQLAAARRRLSLVCFSCLNRELLRTKRPDFITTPRTLIVYSILISIECALDWNTVRRVLAELPRSSVQLWNPIQFLCCILHFAW